MVNRNSCEICGTDVDADERFCEKHKNALLNCENCGNPLKEISERHVINHYVWEEDSYNLTETCYDAAEYYCGKCGAEIRGEQLKHIIEQIE